MPRVLFNKSNAAEMGRRGQIATRRSRIERLLRSVTPAEIPNKSPVDYVHSTLIRARMILDGIYARAERLRSIEAHELASRAAERWTRIEFALAGRPMPGARRPGREAPRESSLTLDVVATHVPQPVATPAPVPRQLSDVPESTSPPTATPLEAIPTVQTNPADVSH